MKKIKKILHWFLFSHSSTSIKNMKLKLQWRKRSYFQFVVSRRCKLQVRSRQQQHWQLRKKSSTVKSLIWPQLHQNLSGHGRRIYKQNACEFLLPTRNKTEDGVVSLLLCKQTLQSHQHKQTESKEGDLRPLKKAEKDGRCVVMSFCESRYRMLTKSLL